MKFANPILINILRLLIYLITFYNINFIADKCLNFLKSLLFIYLYNIDNMFLF